MTFKGIIMYYNKAAFISVINPFQHSGSQLQFSIVNTEMTDN